MGFPGLHPGKSGPGDGLRPLPAPLIGLFPPQHLVIPGHVFKVIALRRQCLHRLVLLGLQVLAQRFQLLRVILLRPEWLDMTAEEIGVYDFMMKDSFLAYFPPTTLAMTLVVLTAIWAVWTAEVRLALVEVSSPKAPAIRWLCGDRISPGMAAEEQLAKGLGIPVQHVGTPPPRGQHQPQPQQGVVAEHHQPRRQDGGLEEGLRAPPAVPPDAGRP